MEEQQCHLWWVFLFAFLLAAASLFSNPAHFDSSLVPVSGVSLVPSMSFFLSYVPSCQSAFHLTVMLLGQAERKTLISQGGGKPVMFVFSGAWKKKRYKKKYSHPSFTTTSSGTTAPLALDYTAESSLAVSAHGGAEPQCFCFTCPPSNLINPLQPGWGRGLS